VPDTLMPRSSEDAARRPSAPRRWRWVVVGLLAVALAGGIAAWRMRSPAAVAPPPSTPTVLTVTTVVATPRSVPHRIPADGPIVAWQEMRLGMELGGLRVTDVTVEEGDTVAAGQLLARLDDSVIAAQLDRADASITEAEASLALSRAELRRVQSLIASQNAARQTLEQREAEVLRNDARLASLRASRAEVAAMLAQTRITAPDAGVILARDILPGSVSVAGQVAFRLLRQGRVELEARVQEMDLAAIRPGQDVLVRHGARSVAGQVRAVAPSLPGNTRLGVVHVALPTDPGLLPGMFALAVIDAGAIETIAVPAEAVVFRDGAPAVFVLESDRARLRRVTIDATLKDGALAIAGGLTAGDRVIAMGAGFLADGDRVQVGDAR
jgi:RND family efflux transporter MFP subunit